MRLIKIIVILIIAIMLFVFAAPHIFINIKGRSLLVDNLHNIFHKQVFIGSVRTTLPFGLLIKDIEVKDLFKIEEVFVGGPMFNIFTKKFSLAQLRLKKAALYIERVLEGESRDKIQNTPTQEVLPSVKGIASGNFKAASSQKAVLQPPDIILKDLVISDSALNFTDRCSGEKAVKITIKDINIEIKNLELPVRISRITYFELTGNIPWQDYNQQGKIWLAGWVNFFKKDMRAELKIEDIDGIYLYPYYSKWVDLEKSRIQKAKLNFFSEIAGLNNDVTVDSYLELSEIEFGPRPEDQAPEKAEKIAAAVVDMFKAINKGKVILPFKFKTKMDSPNFVLNNIIRMAVEGKISQARKGDAFGPEEILKIPTNLIKGTISTATDLTKSVINGTLKVGKELKEGLEDSFTKEENKGLADSAKLDK